MSPTELHDQGLLEAAETMTKLILENDSLQSALVLIACGVSDPRQVAEDALKGMGE